MIRRPPITGIRRVVHAIAPLFGLPIDVLGSVAAYLSPRAQGSFAATSRTGNRLILNEREINAIPSAPRYMPIFGLPSPHIGAIAIGSTLFLNSPREGMVYALDSATQQVEHTYGPHLEGTLGAPELLGAGIVYSFDPRRGFFIDPVARSESVVSHPLAPPAAPPTFIQVDGFRYGVENSERGVFIARRRVETDRLVRRSMLLHHGRYGLQHVTRPVLADATLYLAGSVIDEEGDGDGHGDEDHDDPRHVLYEFSTLTDAIREITLRGVGAEDYPSQPVVGPRTLYIDAGGGISAIDRVTHAQSFVDFHMFETGGEVLLGDVFVVSRTLRAEHREDREDRDFHELVIMDGHNPARFFEMREPAHRFVRAGNYLYAIHESGVTAFDMRLIVGG